MSDYGYLKKYVLPNERANQDPNYNDYKHHFFPLKDYEIMEVEKSIVIPTELKNFYIEIGYGFFFQKDNSSINRLLDVLSFRKINLKEDYYASDPDLELYNDEFYKDKSIFFEVNEGVYILIDKKDNNGENAIYYFTKKIANSLEDFLSRVNQNPNYYDE